MINCTAKIDDKILKKFNDLVRESGVSPQEFLTYVTDVYNLDDKIEKDFINYDDYYESFIG